MKTKYNCIKVSFFILLFLSLINSAQAQLSVSNGASALAVAQALAGPGISVSNATWINTQGKAIGTFISNNTNLGLNKGVILCNGEIATAIGPNNVANATLPAGNLFVPGGFNVAGDADLNSLVAGIATNDAAVLEFDFIPQSDSVRFKYVFASEEYPEYVCGQVNDIFAFFISGPGIVGKKNLALIPGTNLPVSINSVNAGAVGADANCSTGNCGGLFQPACCPSSCNLGNSAYYVSNASGNTIQFDGLTKVLVAESVVQPCQTYRLKIVIADATDALFDSGVFIEAGSLTSTPSVYAGPDVTLCSGQTVAIGSPAAPNYTYTWSPSAGLSSTTVSNPIFNASNLGSAPVTYTYVLTGTKAGCQTITDTVFITVNPVLAVGAMSFKYDTVFCASKGNIINTSVSGNSTYKYTWRDSAGNVIATTKDLNGVTAGKYRLTLQDTLGCSNPLDTLLILPQSNKGPVINLGLASTDSALCASATGAITNNMVSGKAPFSYVWENQNGDTVALTKDLTNVVGGGYTLIVKDSNGCVTRASAPINVPIKNPVVAAFSPNDTTGEAVLNITFINKSQNATKYIWDLGDGNSIVGVGNPAKSFAADGTYNITLIATDSVTGCSDTARGVVIVRENSTLVIPNVFTPNADGTNDVFLVASKGITKLNIDYYNRWGAKIFSTNALNGAWDGKDQGGQECSAGTYYYILKATGSDLKEYELTGFITLIR